MLAIARVDALLAKENGAGYVEYHRGSNLARTREISPELDSLASHLMRLSDEGRVLLVQQRLRTGSLSYLFARVLQ